MGDTYQIRHMEQNSSFKQGTLIRHRNVEQKYLFKLGTHIRQTETWNKNSCSNRGHPLNRQKNGTNIVFFSNRGHILDRNMEQIQLFKQGTHIRQIEMWNKYSCSNREHILGRQKCGTTIVVQMGDTYQKRGKSTFKWGTHYRQKRGTKIVVQIGETE